MGYLHRGRLVTTSFAIATVAVAVTSCGSTSDHSQTASYCAVLSDSVGLYLNNPVTQMGYRIGTITSVDPTPSDVRVGFTIDQNRALPADVRAIVRSPSILADRSMELVGNYHGGPRLEPGACVPRGRTATPLSISQVIGSATDFVNALSPDGSSNLQDSLAAVDQATNGTGQSANKLLTHASTLLDNPDQTVSELGEVTRNFAELTTMLRANRGDLKQIIEGFPAAGSGAVQALEGGVKVGTPLPELVQIVNDLEIELGPDIQLALDATSDGLRVLSPHYKGVADILNFVPRAIGGLNGEPPGSTEGGLAKRINNHLFNLLPWRPPLYRIPTPNGLVACGMLNSSMPGSCADVGGRPYAVDVALLQYVMTAAAAQP